MMPTAVLYVVCTRLQANDTVVGPVRQQRCGLGLAEYHDFQEVGYSPDTKDRSVAALGTGEGRMRHGGLLLADLVTRVLHQRIAPTDELM